VNRLHLNRGGDYPVVNLALPGKRARRRGPMHPLSFCKLLSPRGCRRRLAHKIVSDWPDRASSAGRCAETKSPEMQKPANRRSAKGGSCVARQPFGYLL